MPMPRAKLTSATDVLFGSPAQAGILYLLVLLQGRWLSASDAASFLDIDYNTASHILKRFSNNLKDIEQLHPRVAIYRIRQGSKLLEVLSSLFTILDKKRTIRRTSRTYWLLTTANSSKEIRNARLRLYPRQRGDYFSIVGGERDNFDDLVIQLPNGGFGGYVYITASPDKLLVHKLQANKIISILKRKVHGHHKVKGLEITREE